MSRIECAQAGDWYSLFHSVNEMAAILSAHAESQKQTKEFLQSIISDVSHQIKTPLAALKMYHEIIISHKEDSETVQSFPKIATGNQADGRCYLYSAETGTAGCRHYPDGEKRGKPFRSYAGCDGTL